jgi:RHS repeat-associated protein
VTIEWCDESGLNAGSYAVSLDGVSVKGSFDYVSGNADGCAAYAQSRGTITLTPGTHQLYASISDGQQRGESIVTYTYTQTGTPPPTGSVGISISPSANNIQRAVGQEAAERFILTNTGASSGTFSLTSSCAVSGTTACSTSTRSVTLPGGASTAVGMTYRTGNTVGATGAIRLTAALAENPGVTASGEYNVTLVDLPPAGVVGDVSSITTVERGMCLAAPAGDAAAYECGDLRLAHPFPSVRLLNRPFAPSLLYSSQHARPVPVVGINYTVPGTGSTPTSVTVKLQVLTSPWREIVKTFSVWPAGQTRRLAVSFDGSTVPTGIYDYNVTVTLNGATGALHSTTPAAGKLTIVNRGLSDNYFGRGWWVAGVERLYVMPSDTSARLWVGGDGSVRRYGRLNDTTWAAPAFDRPDTLRRRGSTLVRTLPGRVEVRFTLDGRHAETVNKLGQVTRFIWDGGRLLRIELPRPGYQYVFHYLASGRLSAVTSPGNRLTSIGQSAEGDITVFEDPDGGWVQLKQPTASDPRVFRRVDRRGYATDFTYGEGSRLSSVRHWTLPGAEMDPATASDTIVTRFRPQETQGLADTSVVDPSRLYTKIDGPRLSPVGDSAAFHLDRWGAPARVRDAHGNTTQSVRGDPRWPGLETRVEYPNGRVLTATYDARGNVSSSTDWSAVQGGRYATTLYEWDPYWDAATRITLPEGEVTLRGYTATGELDWIQPGQDSIRRVRFEYRPASDANAPGLVSAVVQPGGATERFGYDARGNLNDSQTPLGARTEFISDALGRDTLVISPISGTSKLRVRRLVDVLGRDTLVMSIGPALSYVQSHGTLTVPAETLFVHTRFNAEGDAEAVTRWASPDITNVGRITTSWVFDALGRTLREQSPDGDEQTLYDPAGNVFQQVTRRGHTIISEYNALNQLTRRTAPAVPDPGAIHNSDTGWSFPLYGNNGGSLYNVPADVAEFAYDVMGNMTVANNGDAKVSRIYDVAGNLRSETQKIRTYLGADTLRHVHTLEYRYDLNGRRTKLRHPGSLAPRDFVFVRDSTTYLYNGLGQLAYVFDPLRNRWDFHYNKTGQLDSLAMPGGFTERYRYDLDGRLRARVETTTQPYTRPRGESSNVLHQDTLVYDERGKVRLATSWSDATTLAYTGLGALAHRQVQDLVFPAVQPTIERYRLDALGNQLTMFRQGAPGADVNAQKDSAVYRYQRNTGRQRAASGQHPVIFDALPVQSADSTVHDPAGNRIFSGSTSTTATGSFVDRSRYYYDASNQLKLVDRRTCTFTGGVCRYNQQTTFDQRGAFEEYRYDALGRRVLVRTRSEYTCSNTSDCDLSVRRFVWDGDQILYEIRYPAGGGGGAPLASIEQDTGRAVPIHSGYDGWGPYGRVAYTHGPGIDAPLGLVRINFNDTLSAPFAVVLHREWRGSVDAGSLIDGKLLGRCVAGQPCLFADWPASQTFAGHRASAGRLNAPLGWMGSLVDNKRDASGQLYMRARYYDPQTGRFTQEDPIGLAGGLNLYGFAEGDPVSYSDPYGLAAMGECPPNCDGSDAAWAMVGATVGGVLGGGGGAALGLACGPGAPACSPVASVAGAMQGAALGATVGVAANNALRTLGQIFEATSSTSGENSAARSGRAMHRQYSATMQQQGYTTNSNIPNSNLRPDAIRINGRVGIIRELKPNNFRAIQRGRQQLARYVQAAQKAWPNVRRWVTAVDTY